MNKNTVRTACAALALILAVGAGLYAAQDMGSRLAATAPAAGDAAVGGAFTLTDQDGQTVTDQSYNGLYRMVFFGFTSCPDICPAAMKKIEAAMALMKDDAAKVQPILITLDPWADTPAVMKDYVSLFGGAKIAGLTGTPEQIEDVKNAYKVYAARVENKDEGSYTIDHSGFIYFMGPDGKFLTVFGSDESPEIIAGTMHRYLQGS